MQHPSWIADLATSEHLNNNDSISIIIEFTCSISWSSDRERNSLSSILFYSLLFYTTICSYLFCYNRTDLQHLLEMRYIIYEKLAIIYSILFSAIIYSILFHILGLQTKKLFYSISFSWAISYSPVKKSILFHILGLQTCCISWKTEAKK